MFEFGNSILAVSMNVVQYFDLNLICTTHNSVIARSRAQDTMLVKP